MIDDQPHEKPAQIHAPGTTALIACPGMGERRTVLQSVLRPHHLHAASAAWSLQAARRQLARLARDNAADALAGNTRTREISIPSQVFGRRHALGGHTDPVGDLALATWRPCRPDPDVLLLNEIDDQLQRLAPSHGDPLGALIDAIPTMRPDTAGRLTVALRRLDDVIRRRLGTIGADTELLPGSECPACHRRPLHRLGAAILCRPDCLCAGDGCRCGMPVVAAGVAHIWTAPAAAKEAA